VSLRSEVTLFCSFLDFFFQDPCLEERKKVRESRRASPFYSCFAARRGHIPPHHGCNLLAAPGLGRHTSSATLGDSSCRCQLCHSSTETFAVAFPLQKLQFLPQHAHSIPLQIRLHLLSFVTFTSRLSEQFCFIPSFASVSSRRALSSECKNLSAGHASPHVTPQSAKARS
jgi:hypothetical protein